MQIGTNKLLLLPILFFIPMLLLAQGGRKYVTRSGDTTQIVMGSFTGLHGKESSFLLDDRISDDFRDRHLRYNVLKEAAKETNTLAHEVLQEKEKVNPTSGSLSFAIIQKNLDYLQKDKEARKIATNNINRDASVQEMAFLYEKFGDKPSYFINGIQVKPEAVASLTNNDILTRSVNVSSTATGNPNGEVWYVINKKAFQRLGIDTEGHDDYSPSYAEVVTVEENEYFEPNTFNDQQTNIASTHNDNVASSNYNTNYTTEGTLTQKQLTLATQQQEIESLRRQIEQAKRGQIQSTGITPSPNSYQQQYVPQEMSGSIPQPTQQSTAAKPKTSSSRSNEVVSFKDSPLERAREQYVEEEEETPKRSVRKIKEREKKR